jgi:hypothetical protein
MQYKSEQINKKEYWEKIDKDNEDIMTRLMVIAGCLFKGYMGW